ncbi:hypothetical protein SDC9_49690 [bioreactor metagenome]|uniref:Uncharacterized protein n=1 Tax=bioreactor metagenome TaxID=1076179 RepID=A0A644WLZ1_9ZZZZ
MARGHRLGVRIAQKRAVDMCLAWRVACSRGHEGGLATHRNPCCGIDLSLARSEGQAPASLKSITPSSVRFEECPVRSQAMHR